MKPLFVALIEPFDYQPFRSIRQLTEILKQELINAGAEVEIVSPFSFLGDITEYWPKVQRVVGAFERITLSAMALRWHLSSLQKKAKKAKREFVVLLSDQALGCLGHSLNDITTLAFVSDLTALRSVYGEFGYRHNFAQRFSQNLNFSGLQHCKAFITPSLSTAQDLARFLPASKDHTTVAPLPLASAFSPVESIELSRQLSILWRKLNILPRAYFLQLGTSAWYKNRKGTIDLVGALKKINPTAPALVFSGVAATDEELAMAKSLNVEIYSFTGLTNAEHNALYCGAEALLMPSFNEGFGWPALEALACGTPLVISDTPALAEHFGAAASLILPTPNPAEPTTDWGQKFAPDLNELLSLDEPTKNEIRTAGISHAARFSPEYFRQQVYNALQSCI